MERLSRAAALTRLQALGAAGGLLAALGVLVYAAALDGDVVLIRQEPPAWWITLAQRPTIRPVQVRRDAPPVTTFSEELLLHDVPERAPLRVRAVRELELAVNGRPVPLPDRDPARWKCPSEVDVAAWLRPGTNRVEASVANPEGPPLLQLHLRAGAQELATGSLWHAERDGQPRPVELAHDVRRHPQAEELPVAWRELLRSAPLLLAAFLPGAALGWRRPRARGAVGGSHWPRTAVAGVALFYAALYAKAVSFPVDLGFDAAGHVEYVRLVAEELRIPLATEGWAMYHAPLYHATTGLVRAALDPPEGALAERMLLHALPVLAAVASAWLAGRLARLLMPGRPGLAALAVLAAGLLPAHVTVAAFPSNEAVHAAFVSASLVAACAAILHSRPSLRRLAGVGGLVGVALLAKSSSAALAPLILASVATGLCVVRGWGVLRAAGAGIGLLAVAALVCGWFYARVWWELGNPLLTNYTLPIGVTYWIIPGFHTPAWFLGFGEVLSHPFFAGFASFADGLYSSFWGDGLASGRLGVEYPNPYWSYARMAAVYPLALPATALGILGLGACALRAVRGGDPARRLGLSLALAVVAVMALVLLGTTLRYPHYGMPKAFYGLPALAPVALAFAVGFTWLDDRLAERGARALRALLAGYGTALAAAIAVAFLA